MYRGDNDDMRIVENNTQNNNDSIFQQLKFTLLTP